jgi:hypothetical protein
MTAKPSFKIPKDASANYKAAYLCDKTQFQLVACQICKEETKCWLYREFGKDGQTFWLCEVHANPKCPRCGTVRNVLPSSVRRGEGVHCVRCWEENRLGKSEKKTKKARKQQKKKSRSQK